MNRIHPLGTSAIAGLILAACNSQAPTLEQFNSKGDFSQCRVLGAESIEVTSNIGEGCINCGVSDVNFAGDGDISTSATLSNNTATGEGVSIRVERTDTVFAAGQTVGVIVSYERTSIAENPYMQLRTYLNGEIQESQVISGSPTGINGPANSTAESYLAEMPTAHPFNAVEFVLGSGLMAGTFTVHLSEFCSDVVGPDLGAGGLGHRASPAAVVADISTGTNPYHAVFRRPDWAEHPSKIIPGFPEDAPALPITLGNKLEQSIQADEDLWSNIQSGVTYWIPGTNLLYLRTRHDDEAFPGVQRGPAYSLADHGVLTSGVIADSCPDCYLLIVADPRGGSAYPLEMLTKIAPWVDVATSTQSATIIGGVESYPAAIDSLLQPSMGPSSEYAVAAKKWVQAGKIYFNGSGNFPSSAVGYPVPLPLLTYLPPWFSIVGGAYEACRSSELMAGKPTEFVAEYRTVAPSYNSIAAYNDVSGTSFSSPFVATHFAQALKIIRNELGDTRSEGRYWSGEPHNSEALADGELTRDELYEAFQKAAVLFWPDEYIDGCPGNSVAVSEQPWVEMGWGYVGFDQARMAADILLGHIEAPVIPAEQQQYMDAYLSIRTAAGSLTP